MPECETDDLDFLFAGPSDDPFSRLLASHLRLTDDLDQVKTELAAEKAKSIALNKAYDDALAQNEKLISLVDGNIPELSSDDDFNSSDYEEPRGRSLAPDRVHRLTFQALQIHEYNVSNEPRGMPVPSLVPPEISKNMEEKPKPKSNSAKNPQRAPSRAKTRTCNCFGDDCSENPYCSCFLRNEPCDNRCHDENPVDVKRMKNQCKRLDRKSAAWKTWVNGGKYIVEKADEPERHVEESIKTTSEKRSKRKDEPKHSTPTKVRRENVAKMFPTGRSKKFACNCWFGDCSNNKMCWCRRNGEPCDHTYCHSDHPNDAINMEKICTRLDFDGEEMEDWLNGGVYPPTSAVFPVVHARKKRVTPQKEKNYG